MKKRWRWGFFCTGWLGLAACVPEEEAATPSTGITLPAAAVYDLSVLPERTAEVFLPAAHRTRMAAAPVATMAGLTALALDSGSALYRCAGTPRAQLPLECGADLIDLLEDGPAAPAAQRYEVGDQSQLRARLARVGWQCPELARWKGQDLPLRLDEAGSLAWARCDVPGYPGLEGRLAFDLSGSQPLRLEILGRPDTAATDPVVFALDALSDAGDRQAQTLLLESTTGSVRRVVLGAQLHGGDFEPELPVGPLTPASAARLLQLALAQQRVALEDLRAESGVPALQLAERAAQWLQRLPVEVWDQAPAIPEAADPLDEASIVIGRCSAQPAADACLTAALRASPRLAAWWSEALGAGLSQSLPADHPVQTHLERLAGVLLQSQAEPGD